MKANVFSVATWKLTFRLSRRTSPVSLWTLPAPKSVALDAETQPEAFILARTAEGRSGDRPSPAMNFGPAQALALELVQEA